MCVTSRGGAAAGAGVAGGGTVGVWSFMAPRLASKPRLGHIAALCDSEGWRGRANPAEKPVENLRPLQELGRNPMGSIPAEAADLRTDALTGAPVRVWLL